MLDWCHCSFISLKLFTSTLYLILAIIYLLTACNIQIIKIGFWNCASFLCFWIVLDIHLYPKQVKNAKEVSIIPFLTQKSSNVTRLLRDRYELLKLPHAWLLLLLYFPYVNRAQGPVISARSYPLSQHKDTMPLPMVGDLRTSVFLDP